MAIASPKRNVGACSVKQFIQGGILAVLPNLQGATVGAETRGAASAASSRPHTQFALRNMRSNIMTKGSNPIVLGFAGVTLLFSASATILALALAGPVAAEQPGSCIELWPDRRGFESMMPDERALRKSTQEELTGATAHLVVYVEHIDQRGQSTLIPFPREMFLFATTNGRYVARIRDLPSDHGWYGPF